MTQPIETLYVEIVPETDDFDRTLDRDTKKSFEKVKKTAQSATRNITTSFRQAARDIDNTLRTQLGATFSSLRADLDSVSRSGTAGLKKTQDSAAQFGTEMGRVSKAIIGTNTILGRLIAVGPSGFNAITAAVLSLGASLAIAARVVQDFITIASFGLAGLPALITGIAVSFLTLRVALSGVSDAYAELTEEENTAGAAGVSNARAVADAQRGLLQAQKDLIKAKEDEIDRIRTLAIEIQRARATEARAADDVLKAEYALQRARDVGTPRSQIEAQLALDEARATLVESKKDTADLAAEKAKADKNGVAGSEQVLRAQEALLDAQDRLAQSQQRFAAGAGATRTAFDGLTKSAQDFLLALVDAEEQLGPVKDAIQEAFFSGSAPLLQPIVDNIKELEPELAGLAGAFGDVFDEILTFLGTPEAKDALKELLKGLTDFIVAITPSIGPLLKAFTSLIGDSGELGDTLGDKVAKGLDKIAKFVSEVDIEQLFKDAKEAAKELKPLIENLGSIFISIFNILAFAGKYILPIFVEGLKNVADTFRFLDIFITNFKKTFLEAVDDVKNRTLLIIEVIKSLPGKISALASKFLAAGKKIIGNFFDGISKAGGFVADFSKNLASSFISFFNRVVIGSINKGIKTIQNGLNRIPGLSFDLPTLSTIPALEKGGLITADSLFRGGEKGKKEAVLPLENSQVMAKIGAAIANAGGGGFGSGIVFEAGAIAMNFYGSAPTPAQARVLGAAAADSIAARLAQRNIRSSIRSM